LDGKVQLIETLLQKEDGVGGGSTWEKRNNQITGAVIDGCVLIEARGDFQGIHLDTGYWHLAGVAAWFFQSPEMTKR
jgi:hypothetical protein